jgi:hypothetical protein
MATAAERMKAHRERARRGLRRFTITVSADDLRVIAQHGYEGRRTRRPGSAGASRQPPSRSVGVEDVLAAFGAARASMKPEIPIKFERDQARLTATNPAWYTQPETNWGGSWLSIRDPQFGWRHYVIPKDDARRLAGYLQTQVNMPVAATPEKVN